MDSSDNSDWRLRRQKTHERVANTVVNGALAAIRNQMSGVAVQQTLHTVLRPAWSSIFDPLTVAIIAQIRDPS